MDDRRKTRAILETKKRRRKTNNEVISKVVIEKKIQEKRDEISLRRQYKLTN